MFFLMNQEEDMGLSEKEKIPHAYELPWMYSYSCLRQYYQDLTIIWTGLSANEKMTYDIGIGRLVNASYIDASIPYIRSLVADPIRQTARQLARNVYCGCLEYAFHAFAGDYKCGAHAIYILEVLRDRFFANSHND
jgi:hypothetical protein